MTRRLVLAAAAILVAACADGSTAVQTSTTSSTATTPVTTGTTATTATTSPTTSSVPSPTTTSPAVECRPPGDEVTTPSGRRVLLRAADSTGPAPTIVVLHGYTGTPEGIERYAELTAAGNGAGITVAYPEGTPTDDGGFGWSTGAAVFATSGTDDVGALNEMLDALVSTGCVDPERLVLAGESNGGGMALIAACTDSLATRLTRVVLVNAAVDDGVLANCVSDKDRPPLTAVAGAVDETVPIGGGNVLLPVSGWFADTATTVSGCTGVADAPPLDAIVTRRVGVGCRSCAELLVIADGTHTWPGTSEGVNGLQPGSFDLNALLLAAAPSPTSPACLAG